MVLESPKKLYAAHMQILIIDESLAKEDISSMLDFLFRDPEIRDEFYVLIGKEEEILNIITPLDNISSQNIKDSLETTTKYLGISNLITFNDLLSIYLNEKKELAIPSLELTGNSTLGSDDENVETTKTDSSVLISSMAVFKDNKLLGYLSESESIAYNFIEDNIKNTLITATYEDGYIIHEIMKSSTKIEANPKENKITITIKGTSSISEMTTKEDITKEENLEKVEKKLNNNIEKLIKDSIKSINEKYNSDIYGFQDLYYKTDTSYYNTIKDTWYDNIFPNIEIEVKSNITIQEKGNLTGGLYNE
jgi:spore germination protein KC